MASAASTKSPAIVRLIILLVIGGLGLWAAIGTTLSMVAAPGSERLTLSIWPWSASALVGLAADRTGLDIPAAQRDQARQMAVSAVEREPANVQAVRTLALLDVQAGRLAEANRLIDYAHTLSRRDVQTEFYSIERLVQKNDVRGALLHYDHALRTSRKAADLLMPVLSQAIGEASVRAELARLLRLTPPWRYEFFSRMLSGTSDLTALADLMRLAKLRSDEPGGVTFTRQLVDRLIAAQRYGDAFTAYRYATGKARLPDLRDGEFETANPIPPIDWWLSDDSDLYAVREQFPGAGGRYALRIVSKDGGSAGGVAARQLLMLSPGRYRLTARIGGVEGTAGADVSIKLRCVDSAHPDAKSTQTLAANGTGSIGLSFDVDDGCGAQWVEFAVEAPDLGEASFWIDDVSIGRLR